MNLHAEVISDFGGSIAINDYSEEFDEYIPEGVEYVLSRYYHFKYSQSCTINVIKYMGSSDEEIIDTIFSKHDSTSDSIRVELPKDGHYTVSHLVLPTYEWYLSVKDKDLSEYRTIYFTNNNRIYKVDGNKIVECEVLEVIETNPKKTTISIQHFNVFNIESLRKCFVDAARDVLSRYTGQCNSKKNLDTFDRDFLFMTIHVICYYLER